MTLSILDIDVAKNTFQLHGADNAGHTVLKKRLPRRELATHVANLPHLYYCDGIMRRGHLLGASLPK